MEHEAQVEVAKSFETQRAVQRLAETLNGKVEYYVGGGLAAYLISGHEFDREFSDIDIMVPETEIDKLEETLRGSGYDFWDERDAHKTREDLEGPYGHHEYGGRDKKGHRVGVYTYDFLEDGRIVMRNHFGERNDEGELVDRVRETVFPAEITIDDLFLSNPATLKGTEVFTVTPEQIYLRKMGSKRLKDKTDAQKLEPFLDPPKMLKIQAAVLKLDVNVK